MLPSNPDQAHAAAELVRWSTAALSDTSPTGPGDVLSLTSHMQHCRLHQHGSAQWQEARHRVMGVLRVRWLTCAAVAGVLLLLVLAWKP